MSSASEKNEKAARNHSRTPTIVKANKNKTLCMISFYSRENYRLENCSNFSSLPHIIAAAMLRNEKRNSRKKKQKKSLFSCLWVFQFNLIFFSLILVKFIFLHRFFFLRDENCCGEENLYSEIQLNTFASLS